MLNKIIQWSLHNRLLVMIGASALLIYGGIVAVRSPVDVFPDLTAPSVTIVTESHGLAPEEVESLVTLPIEAAMNGTAGVHRVRSSSAIGISLVFVEFEFGTDIFRARQLVTEKLQQVRMPEGVSPPLLGPISSTMGEIMMLSMTGNATSAMEVRGLADWVVRPRLLGVSGVSQVVIIGGEKKQFQVLVDPTRLADHGLTLEQVTEAVAASNANGSGGFLERPNEELLIRGRARVNSPEDIADSVIAVRTGAAILVGNVATVQFGPAQRRGDGGFNMQPAVVATIQKQPNANTLEVTEAIEKTLADLKGSLPPDVVIDTKAFQQADFIKRAISNVNWSLIEGGLMVSIVLFLFLWNFRTTFISLTAKPMEAYLAHVGNTTETVRGGEWTITTFSRELRTWDFSTTPIGAPRSADRALVTMAVDITERKLAESDLRRMNEELEQRIAERTAELTKASDSLRKVGSRLWIARSDS